MSVEVRRAGDRFTTPGDGVLSRHSFSFGPHYDPGNVGFGLLVVANDDVASPRGGYPTHPHRDVEIVTWVLSGALVHQDTAGHGGSLEPGVVQRMSAGRGVRHSELAAAAGARFVQMWLPPGAPGADPSYGQADVTANLAGGGLIPVVSGLRRHAGSVAVGLGQPAAALHVARLRPGDVVTLPSAPFVHVYVARGGIVDVETAGTLGEGDAVRVTDEGGRTVTARGDAELLVWEMHAAADLVR
ncbi:pirin family protein [Jiangella anatolica]|uniref:Quercetin 2,3-dioxygenase n=1 Tax=Jiangella anatolica TaxID=2670374 RepID=A0A2W2BA25_9ACTN|nr:pirin family protein [Jiangella anatolica]PZF82972.1 quercetin 2,3-dioxygenase [Jiangella anatolica]